MPSRHRDDSRNETKNAPASGTTSSGAQPAAGDGGSPASRENTSRSARISAAAVAGVKPRSVAGGSASASPRVIDAVLNESASTSRPPSFVVSDGAKVQAARRIVRAADILNPKSDVPKEVLWQARASASARFHLALNEAKLQVELIRDLVPPRSVPERLFGTLLQPSGARAGRV